jgi:hypothetical protein
MARAPKLYRRLPGAASSAFEYLRLYLAADHLLLVASSGFNESYKRFFFRDIQRLSVRCTNGRLWWNLVFGVPFGLCALIVLLGAIDISKRGFRPDDFLALLGFGIPGFIFLCFLVANTILGPACICELQTAVQTRRLPTLNRVPRARKVIAQLKPLIKAAQEPMPPEELARRIDAVRSGTVAASAAPPVIESVAAAPDAISSGQSEPSP